MPGTPWNTDLNDFHQRNHLSSLDKLELEDVPSTESSKSSAASIRIPTLVEDVEAVLEISIHRPTGLKVVPVH
jgi:hypothetical protein